MENTNKTIENLLLENGSSVDGDRLAFEIVDNILPKQSSCYYYDDSDSSSDWVNDKSKPTHVDKRLLYWKNMIRQRRAMQRRLCAATGKKPDELLLNADCREHKTIESLLDRAEQVDQETRDHYNIVGVPKEANRELLGVVSRRNVIKRKWLESQDLTQKIRSEFPNIKNIIEFCPDFDELEVIGKARWQRGHCQQESVYSVSTLNSESCINVSLNLPMNSEPIKLSNTEDRTSLLKLAVSINGTTYQVDRPEYSPILERVFVCNPYEYSSRVVMRIENNGLQTLGFKWKRSEFFAYNDSLFNHDCAAFVFDTEPFQLVSGAFREVTVLFRPRKVGIIKQRWLLMTKPHIFRGFFRALTLNMHGRCKPPQEYLEAIEALLTINTKAARPSWKMHNADKSVLREALTSCPYSRDLSAYEVFNERNVGFHCKGRSDLIELRKFFALVKPPESPLQWNFSVGMLIDLVCVHEDIRQRCELFMELQELLAKLRGRSDHPRIACGENPQNIAQRNRTRFIYVRGIISNCVEVWEQKIWLLSSKMLKVRTVQDSNTRTRSYKQKYSKTFRESLYIYTYDHLCDVVEDIVSVIESTEHVKI